MTGNIPIKILNAIQKAGTEIVETGIKGTEQVLSTVITGQELVGDIKPMNEGEMAKARAEEEKKQEKMSDLRSEMSGQGRNVEAEIEKIVEEKKRKEEEDQKEFLENIKRQREAEEAERQNMSEEPVNNKREAAKRQFAPGKKKKSQAPDPTSMSATSEFKGGKID